MKQLSKPTFYIHVLTLALAVTIAGCTKKVEVRPLKELNVVVIVVDTLAAKHTPVFNTSLDFAPNIARLAKSGVVFHNSQSTAPWTKPAIASLLTGQYPSSHGMQRINQSLSTEHQLIAERFQQLGHATYGVASHNFLEPKYGYSQGFDKFRNVLKGLQPHEAICSGMVTDQALAWLAEHREEKHNKPFFLFAHYFDPHYFYKHHPEFDMTSDYQGELKPGLHIRELRALSDKLSPADIDYLVKLHHEEIAFTDKHIGRLLDYLEKSNLLDNTVIVFTADHGEEFMEHGWIGHTRTLYNELIRVPLIYHFPTRFPARQIDVPVSQVDLLPTLFSLQPGYQRDPAWAGYSLQDLLTGNSDTLPSRDLFAEVDFKSSSHIKDTKQTAIVSNGYKLIHNYDTTSYHLFDLTKDPGELHDCADTQPERLAELKDRLSAWEENEDTNPSKDVPTVEIGDKEVEELKSLGYL